MRLIQDITPIPKAPVITPKVERELDEARQEFEAMHILTKVLVKTLWERNVTIRDIYGMYFALEAQADAQYNSAHLNAEDAKLAGINTEDDV